MSILTLPLFLLLHARLQVIHHDPDPRPTLGLHMTHPDPPDPRPTIHLQIARPDPDPVPDPTLCLQVTHPELRYMACHLALCGNDRVQYLCSRGAGAERSRSLHPERSMSLHPEDDTALAGRGGGRDEYGLQGQVGVDPCANDWQFALALAEQQDIESGLDAPRAQLPQSQPRSPAHQPRSPTRQPQAGQHPAPPPAVPPVISDERRLAELHAYTAAVQSVAIVLSKKAAFKELGGAMLGAMRG